MSIQGAKVISYCSLKIMGVTGIDWQGQSYGACGEMFPITLIYGSNNQKAKLSQNSRQWVFSLLRKLLQPKASATMGRWTYNLETEVFKVWFLPKKKQKRVWFPERTITVTERCENSDISEGMKNLDLNMQSLSDRIDWTRVRVPPPPPIKPHL